MAYVVTRCGGEGETHWFLLGYPISKLPSCVCECVVCPCRPLFETLAPVQGRFRCISCPCQARATLRGMEHILLLLPCTGHQETIWQGPQSTTSTPQSCLLLSHALSREGRRQVWTTSILSVLGFYKPTQDLSGKWGSVGLKAPSLRIPKPSFCATPRLLLPHFEPLSRLEGKEDLLYDLVTFPKCLFMPWVFSCPLSLGFWNPNTKNWLLLPTLNTDLVTYLTIQTQGSVRIGGKTRESSIEQHFKTLLCYLIIFEVLWLCMTSPSHNWPQWKRREWGDVGHRNCTIRLNEDGAPCNSKLSLPHYSIVNFCLLEKTRQSIPVWNSSTGVLSTFDMTHLRSTYIWNLYNVSLRSKSQAYKCKLKPRKTNPYKLNKSKAKKNSS